MANRLSPPRTEERTRDEARMTIIDHLGELRSRIFKVLVVFIAASAVTFYFNQELTRLMIEPSGLDNLNFTAPAEGFFTSVKLSLWAAFVLTVPVFLYQGWSFVVPAVGDVGRVFTYITIALASSLFLAGVFFGYSLTLPVAMNFLLGWNGDLFNDIITGNQYLSFATRLLLAFGIAFELPAATYVGARLGLIDAQMLRKYRRHALVTVAVASAMLTPPDPFSMLLMMVPLVVLYEGSVLIARYVNPVTESEEESVLDEYLDDEDLDGEGRQNGRREDDL
ncbi:MAG: twin-arginine translocase subunit TatC [Rubrobacter sp.]|nr:twin-arginine translocase subunit TatC [Rubrobacter sp.]